MDENGKLSYEQPHYDLIAKNDYWVVKHAVAYITRYYLREKKYDDVESAKREFWAVYKNIYSIIRNALKLKTLELAEKALVEQYDPEWGAYDELVLDDSLISPAKLVEVLAAKSIEMPKEFAALLPRSTATIDPEPQAAKRLTTTQIDKLVCQAIGKTLWHEHPDMTNEEMQNHHAIQVFGSGAIYKGKNTLRDWLSEVDPRSDEHKPGVKKKK